MRCRGFINVRQSTSALSFRISHSCTLPLAPACGSVGGVRRRGGLGDSHVGPQLTQWI